MAQRLKILNSDGTSYNNIEIGDYTYVDEYMGEEYISAKFSYPAKLGLLKFRLTEKVVYKRFDQTDVGVEYFLINPPTWSKNNEKDAIEYSMQFKAKKEILKFIPFIDVVKLDANNPTKYYTGKDEFSFYGDHIEYANRILASILNETGDSAWTLSLPAMSTDPIEVAISGMSCFDALSDLYEKFKIPFIVKGKTIELGASQPTIGHTFRYGVNNGLYEITREISSQELVTKLRVYGSEDNLPSNYLQAINPTKLPIPHLMPARFRREQKDYYTSSNYDPLFPRVFVKQFPEIKPTIKGVTVGSQRIDKLRAVVFNGAVDENKVETNGDVTVPTFKLKLYPLGFTLKDSLSEKGEPTIKMTTGLCAGCSFIITKIENDGANGVIVTVKKDIASYNTLMPVYPTIVPKAGDEFVFLYINLPESYITAAEAKLETEAQEYLAQNSVQKYRYECRFDEKFLKLNPTFDRSLVAGAKCPISENLNYEAPTQADTVTLNVTSITIDYAEDKVLPSYTISLEDGVSSKQGAIGDIVDKIEESDRVNNGANNGNTVNARRTMIAIKNILNNMFDPDGNNKFEQLVIQALAAEFGSDSQAFFLNGMSIEMLTKNTIKILGNGTLSHTLYYRNEGATMDDFVWNVTPPSQDLTMTVDASVYYLYIQANKANNSAVWVLSPQQMTVNQYPDSYMFLFGTVTQMLTEGTTPYRKLISTNGKTIIIGGTIYTNELRSPNYSAANKTGIRIDFVNGFFYGDMRFMRYDADKTISEVITAMKSEYSYLNNVFANSSTEQSGGVTLGAFMGVKRGDGSISAFMNGLVDAFDGSAFSAGVTGFGTADEKRVIDIKHMGEGTRIGNMRIMKDSVEVLDDSGNPRVIITRGSVNSPIAGSLTKLTFPNGNGLADSTYEYDSSSSGWSASTRDYTLAEYSAPKGWYTLSPTFAINQNISIQSNSASTYTTINAKYYVAEYDKTTNQLIKRVLIYERNVTCNTPSIVTNNGWIGVNAPFSFEITGTNSKIVLTVQSRFTVSRAGTATVKFQSIFKLPDLQTEYLLSSSTVNQVIVGTDGIGYVYSPSQTFYIRNKNGRVQVIGNLPTTATDIGELYCGSDGVVRRKMT